ncbi:uncharacterized protein [Spinacia oleracea]|uniref:Uncharacterized protein n=1 Tax=Spinacia oleracea TaxID=3562 RepID=A0A9R0INE1_SPIOL|nr:uncharacterized protein LOC110791772 [Spinacia oleracea]
MATKAPPITGLRLDASAPSTTNGASHRLYVVRVCMRSSFFCNNVIVLVTADKVFGPNASTEEVYNIAARPIVKISVDGVMEPCLLMVSPVVEKHTHVEEILLALGRYEEI